MSVSTSFLAVLLVPAAVLGATSDRVEFLRSKQDAAGLVDGSVRSTDWAVIGVSAAGIDPATVGSPSLVDAVSNNPVSSSSATELERRILALRAAGRSATAEVSQLLSFQEDHQLGRSDMVNDDVFGVLALVAVGGAANVVANSVTFIQANQNSDGGFSSFVGGSSDVDSSAAALAALAAGRGSSEAIDRGFSYLSTQQEASGGFGVKLGGSGANVDSTSWALWAYHTTGRSNAAARSWLNAQQRSDGSFGGAVSTAHTLIALSDRALPIIGSFSTPSPQPAPLPLPALPVPSVPSSVPSSPPRSNPSLQPSTTLSQTSVSSSVSVGEVGASANASGSAAASGRGVSTSGGATSSSSTSMSEAIVKSQPSPSASQPVSPPRETGADTARRVIETKSQSLPRVRWSAPLYPEQELSAADEPLTARPSPLAPAIGWIDPVAARTEAARPAALVRNLVLALLLIGTADGGLIALGVGRWFIHRFRPVLGPRF